MKKVGILLGKESTFPHAVIDAINSKEGKEVVAEYVYIDKVIQGDPTQYAVIIDRISHDVPFYRAYLKNAAITGTAVLNNPFWWTADDKFFNNAIALNVGVPVPKTVLLPSNQLPPDTSEMSMRNLAYPLDWGFILEHIGFPAFLKPYSGGGWKNVYRVNNVEELLDVYNNSNQLVLMMQENIAYEEYFRCYCIDRKHVKIMRYEPANEHWTRYDRNPKPIKPKMHKMIEDYTLRLNRALGYDINTVEFAVRDGVPYAIDFCNPVPDSNVASVGEENFAWVVDHVSNMAIERAKNFKQGHYNLTWGTFVDYSVQQKALALQAKK